MYMYIWPYQYGFLTKEVPSVTSLERFHCIAVLLFTELSLHFRTVMLSVSCIPRRLACVLNICTVWRVRGDY